MADCSLTWLLAILADMDRFENAFRPTRLCDGAWSVNLSRSLGILVDFGRLGSVTGPGVQADRAQDELTPGVQPD